MPRRADVSLLFDFFVTSQRLRRVLSDGMADAGMRPDQYALYSLLFEKAPMTATEMAEFLALPLTTVLDYLKEMSAAGHIVRTAHPLDGRAVQLSLSRSGAAAHRRANAHWEVVRRDIEGNLALSVDSIRRGLRAVDDAAVAASRNMRTRLTRRAG